jgi:hypothetical protein
LFDNFIWDKVEKIPSNGNPVADIEELLSKIFQSNNYDVCISHLKRESINNSKIKNLLDKIMSSDQLAVRLTFEMLKKAENYSFTDCLKMENIVNKKLSLLNLNTSDT